MRIYRNNPITELNRIINSGFVVVLERQTDGIDDEFFVDMCASRLRELGRIDVITEAEYGNEDSVDATCMRIMVPEEDEDKALHILSD